MWIQQVDYSRQLFGAGAMGMGGSQGLSPLASLSGLSDRLIGSPIRPGWGANPQMVSMAAGVGGYLGSMNTNMASGYGSAWSSAGVNPYASGSWAAAGPWGSNGNWAAAGVQGPQGGSWAAAGSRPGESWAAAGTYSNSWSSGAPTWSGGWGGSDSCWGGSQGWAPGGWGCRPSPCDWMCGWHGGWCHQPPSPPPQPPVQPPVTPPQPPVTPPQPPVTPPQPPVTPPQPPVVDTNPAGPGEPLPLVPHVDTDQGWMQAFPSVAVRLHGTEEKREAIHMGGKSPWTNEDGKKAERSAVWAVMQLSDQLRYDVDKQVFFTLDSKNNRQDRATLADVLEVRSHSHPEMEHIDTARYLRDHLGLGIPGLPSVSHWDNARKPANYDPQVMLQPGYFWRPPLA